MFSLVTFSLDTNDYGHLFPYRRGRALVNTYSKNELKRKAVKCFWCCISTEKTKEVKSRLKDECYKCISLDLWLFKPDLLDTVY